MNHLEPKLDLKEKERHTLGFDVAHGLEVVAATVYGIRFRQLDVGEEDVAVVGVPVITTPWGSGPFSMAC
jgi:hypothetical protein